MSNASIQRARRRRPAPSNGSTIDRLPPHSFEAEQGVLGCILLAPHECMDACLTKMRGRVSVFYDLRHQQIYSAMTAMRESGIEIDLVTLQQRLRDGNKMEDVGGIQYLSSLCDTVPSAANLDYYLDIIVEKNLLRRMVQTCTEVVGRIYDHEGEVDELLDEAERDILSVLSEGVTEEAVDSGTLVHRAINRLEELQANPGQLNGIATGFHDLDRMTGGLKPGNMIVIAARPSMGKTSLAMNISEHVSAELGIPVGVFSLEMTDEELMMRMLCSRSRVDLSSATDGFLNERDFQRLTTAAGQIQRAPLWIDDTSGLSILQLRARARRMCSQHGIRLLVIDYLQLLHSTSRKAQENRTQEVTDISNGIKALAKELGIPVIVLSQLNRESERDRKSRKPRLSDLRESGAIEQDADLVGLLYKSNHDDEDDFDDMTQPVNLLIAKQRNGPTGDVHLTFLKQFTRFESASRITDADVPG